MTEHKMEKTHPVLKDTPKVPLYLIGGKQGKAAGKTQVVKTKDFPDALKQVNEVLTFEITCLDGNTKTVEQAVRSENDLIINPKASKVEQTGIIQNIPELRKQYTLQKQLQTLSDSLSSNKRQKLDELLKSERKQHLIAYLRRVHLQLDQF